MGGILEFMEFFAAVGVKLWQNTPLHVNIFYLSKMQKKNLSNIKLYQIEHLFGVFVAV